MNLYLVGQTTSEDIGLFEIQGIFSSKEKAIPCCYNDSFWWVKFKLNEELPTEPINWDKKIIGVDYDYPTIGR